MPNRKVIKSGIYLIKCIPNNKVYVGSSVDMTHRFTVHRDHLRKNKHGNPYLQNDFNEYGESQFCFIRLHRCAVEELFTIESEYINTYDSLNREKGYNIWTAGSMGRKCADETKDKIRETLKGVRPPILAVINSGEVICRKVVDKATGRIYKSITEAAEAHNMPMNTLSCWLRGVYPNRSSLSLLNQ